ncbi:hypothetical protein ACIQ1D_20480 [Lysinibacillus xylanilyticus]|uniref:hypothetical protein n=1 Tax=Lysinibacillus xylanilyticus TaxID=582475 RepID=UPI003811035B
MISNQETFNLSPYMAIYDIVVPKVNILRQINELVNFSFILEELKTILPFVYLCLRVFDF